MDGSKIILDTNIVIKIFTGDKSISAIIEKSQFVYLPVIVLGELLLGANRSINIASKLKQIESFLQNCHVLPVDEFTSESYATIKTALLVKGKPIPENDIWIAALALQHSLPVCTLDQHFNEIEQIRLVELNSN